MESSIARPKPISTAFFSFVKFYWKTLGNLRALKANVKDGKIVDYEVADREKQAWSEMIFEIMKIQVKVSGRENLRSDGSALFVGNHISYLDIPLLFSVVPVASVAQEVLVSWPTSGPCIRAAGMLLVKREDSGSGRNAAKAVANEVLERNRPVAIFPSGTTTIDERKPWRWGAFKIAHEHSVPVQPFRLRFKPLRKSAYIDDDLFLTHFIRLLREPKIVAELEFGEPFYVKDVKADAERVQKWAQDYVAE